MHSFNIIEATTSYVNLSSEQYSKGGGLVTETLNNIRTVTALNMQTDLINRYRIYLIQAMNAGILKSFKLGVSNGFVYSILFATSALGFW